MSPKSHLMRSLLLIAALILLAGAAIAADSSAKDTNVQDTRAKSAGAPQPASAAPSLPMGSYVEVPGKPFVFDGQTVEVIEFMSFYCGHCYLFERNIPVILGNYPKKIKWRTIPLFWGTASIKPGEAYLLAEEAGLGERMKQALFRAQMVEKLPIGDVNFLNALGRKIGLGDDYANKLKSGAKTAEAMAFIAMAQSYGLKETPTVIVAGNRMTTPRGFSGLDAYGDNIIAIIGNVLSSGKNPAK